MVAGAIPTDEAQAATPRLEAGNTATNGLLALDAGGPFGALESVGGGQYRRRHGGHPRTSKTSLFIRKQLSYIRSTQRLLDPVDDFAGFVLNGHVVWALLAPLVESGAPSVAQPYHDAFGIPGPTEIAAVIHAEKNARAGMFDAVDADLLTHRGPPPFT